jgi:hypothetical protein
MKNVLFVLALVLSVTSISYGQNTVEGLLKKYNNDKGALAFNLNGDLSYFFNQVDGEDSEIKSKLENLSVLIFKGAHDVKDQDKAKMKTLMTDQGYDMLVNAKHEGSKVKVYAIDSGSYLERLFAEVNTGEQNIYLSIKGEIHYEDIAKLNMDEFAKTGKLLKD